MKATIKMAKAIKISLRIMEGYEEERNFFHFNGTYKYMLPSQIAMLGRGFFEKKN